MYNVEAKDQDITKALARTRRSRAVARRPARGVTAITGKYADGSAMLAVPNYARDERGNELPPEAGPQAAIPSLYLGADGAAGDDGGADPGAAEGARPVVSAVWLPKG